MHTHTFYMLLYIFLLLHPPCSSFPSTCHGSTRTRAASLLSVGACPSRNHGLCVWRVKTAGGGGWCGVVWCGGVGWGGLLLLHLAFLGWVSGPSIGTFPRLSRIANSPSTMTAAGGRVWMGNFIWSVILRGKGDRVQSWNPLWSLKAAGCIQFNYRKKPEM